MSAQPVILIFDVGKTNKKILLFDRDYNLVHEESTHLQEITDEDGFHCENLNALTNWLTHSFDRIVKDNRFNVKAINFSGYGASFVYLDERYKPVLQLYNYLKPYPETLKRKFYNTYGGELEFARRTASPVLGNLNSAMQLYRIKNENPKAFDRIEYALHLPQYLSFVLTRQVVNEITSIGCHTNLWDFQKQNYHEWVSQEGLLGKFPSIINTDKCTVVNNIKYGIGIHDSSAALVPYLACFNEPFVLLSTGTWSISLNPFNDSPLTQHELGHDCLCYLSHEGKPVKAARLFAGHTHEEQVHRISEFYQVPVDYFNALKFSAVANYSANTTSETIRLPFEEVDLGRFENPTAAYYQFIKELVQNQVKSTHLVYHPKVKQIFVDGGFSKNDIYMNLLAKAYPKIHVYAASVAQASALGAALVIHNHWNDRPIPQHLIELQHYHHSVNPTQN